MIGRVVSKFQNAFIEGRQIIDVTLIVDEAIDFMLRSNSIRVICKLDIGKAYDHVNWGYLLAILDEMGFGKKWIKWIKWCIFTTIFLVLVSGTLSIY